MEREFSMQNSRLFTVIFVVAGVISFCAGASLAKRAVNLKRHAIRAQGIVVENIPHMDFIENHFGRRV